jgi:hypothetical protein
MDKRVLTFVLAVMLMLSSMTLVVPHIQARVDYFGGVSPPSPIEGQKEIARRLEAVRKKEREE